MYLTEFAQTSAPLDITGTAYFSDALRTAADLGGTPQPPFACVSRNLLVQGLRLHMTDWGAGAPDLPALVLLHGGAVTGRTWGPFCALLAHKYRLIAVDMRGHGDSEWPRDAHATHNTMAEDVRQIITQLQLERPVVVGHSVGGMLLMRLMVHTPELLRGAVLVDVGPEVAYPGWEPKKEVHETVRLYESVDEYVSRQAPRMKRSEEHMRRNAQHELMQREDGLYQLKFDPRHPMGGLDGRFMPGMPDLEALRRVTLPTLVARGAQSWFLLQDAAERLAQTLPRGELAVIPDCEHMVYTDNPAALAQAVDRFVAAL